MQPTQMFLIEFINFNTFTNLHQRGYVFCPAYCVGPEKISCENFVKTCIEWFSQAENVQTLRFF